ncbi:helix-hairpin-helix domain-containing protein [Micromonospora sp. KLBMP9576]|uniref:helix-hairpin-helix domain-containing protein n=1 Tax=Micromonospora sp. KLBMP9576 TaxID=3424769 RepID=UPI003D8D8784
MDGDPVAGVTAVVVDPPPVAVLDEARPEVTVDPTPDAVADRAPAAPGADTPTDPDATNRDASPVTVVASDAPRADDIDPADMALTGDPVPVPDVEPAPLARPTADTRTDNEVVLPVAAEVTGPVDHRPAQTPAPDAEPVPATPAEPEPVASAPTAEPATATPAQPEPVAVPAEPVAVPAPRGESHTPADADAADDFRRIQGVGPKMAAALQAAGIRTYRQLAELDEAALRETIRAAGLRGAPSLATWPQQAKVLAGAPQEAAAALPAPAGDTDA